MIETQDISSTEFEGARDCVPDDGRAQVAHMHLLGHIGRREVDDHALPRETWGPGVDALLQWVQKGTEMLLCESGRCRALRQSDCGGSAASRPGVDAHPCRKAGGDDDEHMGLLAREAPGTGPQCRQVKSLPSLMGELLRV